MCVTFCQFQLTRQRCVILFQAPHDLSHANICRVLGVKTYLLVLYCLSNYDSYSGEQTLNLPTELSRYINIVKEQGGRVPSTETCIQNC